MRKNKQNEIIASSLTAIAKPKNMKSLQKCNNRKNEK